MPEKKCSANIFGDTANIFLKLMRIDAIDYSYKLITDYNDGSTIIDALLSKYFEFDYQLLSNEEFIEFMEVHKLDEQTPLYDHAYDMFNYVRLYKDGGAFGLYKGRQAEWGGPTVKIQKEDVPLSNVDSLYGVVTVYRGMQEKELENSSLGQSWTLDIGVARKFAFEVYCDEPRGVLVKSKIGRNQVLYYQLDDSEQEVIVQSGSVKEAEIIER